MSTTSAGRIVWPQSTGYPFGDVVAAAADHVLNMEMLKRGYAVAKMPPEQLLEELNT
jgi:hypothetical protein